MPAVRGVPSTWTGAGPVPQLTHLGSSQTTWGLTRVKGLPKQRPLRGQDGAVTPAGSLGAQWKDPKNSRELCHP
jgi:hypothetical protein